MKDIVIEEARMYRCMVFMYRGTMKIINNYRRLYTSRFEDHQIRFRSHSQTTETVLVDGCDKSVLYFLWQYINKLNENGGRSD